MQRYGDRLLAYAEEAGEDIGTVGVERRRSDASEWGEFEGRHNERGFEGRTFRESSGGRDSRSSRPTVEEANSAFSSTPTRNPASAASANAPLPNPVSIKYASTQPPLPPNQSSTPVTVPTSPRIVQSFLLAVACHQRAPALAQALEAVLLTLVMGLTPSQEAYEIGCEEMIRLQLLGVG